MSRIDDEVYCVTHDITGMMPVGEMLESTRIDPGSLRDAVVVFVRGACSVLECKYKWIAGLSGRQELMDAIKRFEGLIVR